MLSTTACLVCCGLSTMLTQQAVQTGMSAIQMARADYRMFVLQMYPAQIRGTAHGISAATGKVGSIGIVVSAPSQQAEHVRRNCCLILSYWHAKPLKLRVCRVCTSCMRPVLSWSRLPLLPFWWQAGSL